MTAFPEQWLQHVFRHSIWNTREQSKVILAIAGFLVLFAGVVYVFQISAVASQRHDLNEMIAQRNSLEREVEMLREAITSLQDLSELQERAIALGFRRASQDEILYLEFAEYRVEETARTDAEIQDPILRLSETRNSEAGISNWLLEFRRQWQDLAAPFE